MPVISTAFDDDFFDESVIETDRIESPCKRKCSKPINKYSEKKKFFLFFLKNAI